MTPKMDFFISPAYLVPPMRTIFFVKSVRMKVRGTGAVALGNGFKFGGGDDGELGRMRREFVPLRDE